MSTDDRSLYSLRVSEPANPTDVVRTLERLGADVLERTARGKITFLAHSHVATALEEISGISELKSEGPWEGCGFKEEVQLGFTGL